MVFMPKKMLVIKMENGKQRMAILACSDLDLSTQNIAQYYCLRFQMLYRCEGFIFRDSK